MSTGVFETLKHERYSVSYRPKRNKEHLTKNEYIRVHLPVNIQRTAPGQKGRRYAPPDYCLIDSDTLSVASMTSS